MAETPQPPPPARARAVVDPQLPHADQLRLVLARVDGYRRAESGGESRAARGLSSGVSAPAPGAETEALAALRRYRYDANELPSWRLRQLIRLTVIGVAGSAAFALIHGPNPLDWPMTPGADGAMMILAVAHDLALAGVGLTVARAVYGIVRLIRTIRQAGQETPDEQLLVSSSGHYLLSWNLDPQAHHLLARAQTAVDAVMTSAVHQAGLIDTIGNRVLLPTQEWEIANAVHGLSAMRARHPELAADTAGGPAAAPAEGSESPASAHSSPARAAYREAVETVTRRVGLLEAYAEQVKAADAAYHLTGGRQDQLDSLMTQARITEQALRQTSEQTTKLSTELSIEPA